MVRCRVLGSAGLLIGLALSVHALASTIHLSVPFFPDTTDQCGPSTLAGILSFWGQPTDPKQLRQEMYTAKLHGTLPMDLLTTAEQHGLQTDMQRGTLNLLRAEIAAGRPLLVMLNMGYSFMPIDHYVIVTGFDDTRQGLWMHSAGRRDQFISYKKFMRVWEKTDYWTLRLWVAK